MRHPGKPLTQRGLGVLLTVCKQLRNEQSQQAGGEIMGKGWPLTNPCCSSREQKGDLGANKRL